jgi:hypothetical protein
MWLYEGIFREHFFRTVKGILVQQSSYEALKLLKGWGGRMLCSFRCENVFVDHLSVRLRMKSPQHLEDIRLAKNPFELSKMNKLEMF